MARPKFFTAFIGCNFHACYSGTLFAETEISVQALAPIIITAQQGNEASGLIVQADPKSPFSLYLRQMVQIICKVLLALVPSKWRNQWRCDLSGYVWLTHQDSDRRYGKSGSLSVTYGCTNFLYSAGKL